MKYIGKAIATITIWGGTAGLCYMFHSFDLLDSTGAGLMTVGAILLTGGLWKFDW